MSVSTKSIFKINKLKIKNNFLIPKKEERDISSEKPRNHICLKNSFYKLDNNKKNNNDLSILNFILYNFTKKGSAKTAISDSIPAKLDYNLCMINKYDENLNTSLSFISEFDLEKDENEQDDSFNSSDNDDDNSLEQIEIKTKSSKRISENICNVEIELEFEKDWNDIKELIMNKKSSQ